MGCTYTIRKELIFSKDKELLQILEKRFKLFNTHTSKQREHITENYASLQL